MSGPSDRPNLLDTGINLRKALVYSLRKTGQARTRFVHVFPRPLPFTGYDSSKKRFL